MIFSYFHVYSHIWAQIKLISPNYFIILPKKQVSAKLECRRCSGLEVWVIWNFDLNYTLYICLYYSYVSHRFQYWIKYTIESIKRKPHANLECRRGLVLGEWVISIFLFCSELLIFDIFQYVLKMPNLLAHSAERKSYKKRKE